MQFEGQHRYKKQTIILLSLLLLGVDDVIVPRPVEHVDVDGVGALGEVVRGGLLVGAPGNKSHVFL